MRRPNWQVYHTLGESIAPQLPEVTSCADIARKIGGTRQTVYHEVMVALGKLVAGMRQRWAALNSALERAGFVQTRDHVGEWRVRAKGRGVLLSEQPQPQEVA